MGATALCACGEINRSAFDNNRFGNLVRGAAVSPANLLSRGLFDGLALAIALFQKTQVVQDVFVGGILAPGGDERCMRPLVVPTQHIRVSLIVENRDRRPKNTNSLSVGAIGKVKSPQTIIGRCETEPRLGVARMGLNCLPEMFFGKSEIVGTIVLLAET